MFMLTSRPDIRIWAQSPRIRSNRYPHFRALVEDRDYLELVSRQPKLVLVRPFAGVTRPTFPIHQLQLQLANLQHFLG